MLATSATVLVQGFRLFGCSAVRRFGSSAVMGELGRNMGSRWIEKGPGSMQKGPSQRCWVPFNTSTNQSKYYRTRNQPNTRSCARGTVADIYIYIFIYILFLSSYRLKPMTLCAYHGRLLKCRQRRTRFKSRTFWILSKGFL